MPDCRYYQIAGLTVQVESDLPITETTFRPKFTRFEVAGPGDDPIVIRHHFGMPDLKTMDWGRCVYRKAPWAIYRKGEAWIYLTVLPGTNDTDACDMAIFSDDHTRADMYHAREDLYRTGNWHSLTLFPTDQILLARVLADRRGCYLHAAGASLTGHGLLFAGHADAGKTTMVRMLLAAGTRAGGGGNEVEILCDDRMIVRKWPTSVTGDGPWRIHGTWSHGEAPEVSPNSAPLRAILFLEQACENRVIPLRDRKEIVTRLLACLITPLTCADWWERSLTVVEQIAREAPCYILRFDKSGDVVGVLEELRTVSQ